MDVNQVNSRAVHDEPEPEAEVGWDPASAEGDTGHGISVEDGEHVEVGQEKTAGTTDLEKQPTVASTAASHQETYPEGGREAWLVVLGAWFAMISAMGMLNMIGIFQAYILSHQLKGQSESTVGWIFSLYTFLAFFCGVYIGPVFDKYGPKWLVVAGALCTVLGVLLMSFCQELWQFILSFGVLAGLGTSLLFTPSIAAIGHWFKARRGFATGIAATAGGVGGIIFPLVLSKLFDEVGFGWATRALALICLCCSFVGIFLVRSRLPPAQNATAHPDFRIFRQVEFSLATAAVFLLEFALFIPLTYTASYAMHQGFSEDFAYNLTPILSAGSVVGRVLPGYYADVVGPFNTCMLSVVLSMVAVLCLWLPLGHTTPGIILYAVLFGFGSGTCISVSPVCIGQMCKTQEYGRYYATTYTIVSFACLIGIPIAGALVEADGGEYDTLIIFTGAIFAGSIAFFMAAKISILGWGGWRAAY